MRQFLKVTLASCLGTIFALIVVSLIGMGIFSRLAQQANQPPEIASNSVLHLQFNSPIPERTNNIEMNPFDFENRRILGLQDIVRTLEAAAEDDQIRGAFLEIGNVSFSQATMGVLHDALADFKAADKFVYAYGEYIGQGAYYLSSVSDQIVLNPIGEFFFTGFSATIPFFKTLLDKVGIDMQIFYAGQFKSATEPYRLTEMSEANRMQVREFLEELYSNYLEDIAANRSISVEQLQQLTDSFSIRRVEDALEYGLIDGLGYRHEARDWMRNYMGLEEEEELEMVSLESYYLASKESTDFTIKDKIAILYAEGAIVMGEGEVGTIGDQRYNEIIREIREDDNIKAVVLRVNSPGGSALASENIWQELNRLKESGKPLVVSMGDYAASGGYFLACGADTIVTHPNTIAGSIGVFSIVPNASDLFNEHLGITFDTVKTGATIGLNTIYELSPEQQEWMQTSVDSVYEFFLQRVAEGRDMTRDEVHAIAQGRVWTGEAAVGNGLADLLGDLDDAIEIASRMAGVEEYRLSEYPDIKEPLEQFIEEITGSQEQMQAAMLRQHLGQFYAYYQHMRSLENLRGPQARLPFLIQPE